MACFEAGEYFIISGSRLSTLENFIFGVLLTFSGATLLKGGSFFLKDITVIYSEASGSI